MIIIKSASTAVTAKTAFSGGGSEGDHAMNPLLAEEEAALREWLARMNETNPEKVEAAIAKCRTDPKARMSCLEQAKADFAP